MSHPGYVASSIDGFQQLVIFCEPMDQINHLEIKAIKYASCLSPLSAKEGNQLPPLEKTRWDSLTLHYGAF